MLIDSDNNLTALQTAVKVKAEDLLTDIPADEPLPALIAERKSLFSGFLNKFLKKSVIAKSIVFGIVQLYDNLFF